MCGLKGIDSSVYNQYQRMQKKKIAFKGLIGIFSQLEKLQIVQQKKPSIISSLFLAAKYAATK